MSEFCDIHHQFGSTHGSLESCIGSKYMCNNERKKIYSAWKMRLLLKFDALLPIRSFPLTVSRTSFSRYQITYQGTRLALGVWVIIINTHS